MQPPLTKSTTDRSIGHMPEAGIAMIIQLDQILNTRQVPFYPDQLINVPPRQPDTKTQDNRRTTLY